MFRGNLVAMGDVENVLIEPKHPYVKLLRDCIPETDLSKRWKTKVRLSESDTEEYLRVGCKFAGRCPQVMEICRREIPRDVDIDGALIKCQMFQTPS
jgi:peptide/nickel transport system ATP-binding protein